MTVTSTKNNQNRKRRFLSLFLGIGAMALPILSAGFAKYLSEQLMKIISRLSNFNNNLSSLTKIITKQHDQLVTLTKRTNLLY